MAMILLAMIGVGAFGTIIVGHLIPDASRKKNNQRSVFKLQVIRLCMIALMGLGVIGLVGVTSNAHAYGGSSNVDAGPKPVAVYKEGDRVRILLNGKKGQVIGVVCPPGAAQCIYVVKYVTYGENIGTSYNTSRFKHYELENRSWR